MKFRKIRQLARASFKHWLDRLVEAHLLFPLTTLFLLCIIWGTAAYIILLDRNTAERAAIFSSRELLETYEAQAVRRLHEIDQTLKFIKYTYELKHDRNVLRELGDKALLPSDMLFAVTLTDETGNVLASTQPHERGNIYDASLFDVVRTEDTLYVSPPRRAGSDWKLLFGRRLAENGRFSGTVTATIDAAYFVSGYQNSKLGQQGLLGILGRDGVFKAARIGDNFFVGEAVDFDDVMAQASTKTPLLMSPWDSVARYTAVHELNDFPLAVIVGLSQEEQLADSQGRMWGTILRAMLTSIVVVMFLNLLHRANKQRALNRQYEREAAMEHAARVEYLAYHDGLTALPNRSLFSKLLAQGIAQAKRNNRQMAILFLDLDHFKQINDTLGHEAGDQLLQEVARRLREGLRESDTVARLGGDEFVVLLPELEEIKFAGVVAEKILKAIAKPFILMEQEFRVTTSIGISIYPKDGLDEETLKKHADIAMYQAKGEGKNHYHFYSEQLNIHSLERLTLESSLRHALERSEFQLHYQAKRDTRTGAITGMEALLRWQHPHLGMVEPMKFIP
ncbi:MAG TPA: diguanylate cyclase, partial [Methylophilaceae bacterium]|nr:diguanylate cyclase [Methylophilaceae bacterium]